MYRISLKLILLVTSWSFGDIMVTIRMTVTIQMGMRLSPPVNTRAIWLIVDNLWSDVVWSAAKGLRTIIKIIVMMRQESQVP